MRFFTFNITLFLLFVCSVISLNCYAQNSVSAEHIITRRLLTMEDGLPSRQVFDAVQDQDGFMWFATGNGLCRYDGHSFKIYNTQNSALPSNIITALGIDAKNRLFIQSTPNFGLSDVQYKIQVLELNTGRFIPLHQALPDRPFLNDQDISLIHDALGNIFFLTDHSTKIWQYSKNQMVTLRLNLKNNLKGNLSSFSISNNSIKSANGCLLIRDIYSKQSCCVFPDTTMFFDDNKFIPLAITEKKEYILYDVSSKAYTRINSFGKKEKFSCIPSMDDSKTIKPTLNNFDGNSLLFKSSGNDYFLHTGNQWVNIYNSDDKKKYPVFGISSYFRDRTDNYWFCTEKGIYQVNFRLNRFEHYFSDTPNEKYINNAVRGIYVNQDSTGKKTVYAMVNYVLLEKNQEEKTIPNITATVLLKKNGCFYFAGNPLMTYNPVSGKVKKLEIYKNISEIWSMADISDSLLLLGGTEGIVIYNTVTNVSAPISFANKNIPSPQFVYRILNTKRKGWVAVAENGIYFINKQPIIFDYYGTNQQTAGKKFPFAGIFDFYEDKEGIAWLAMNGEGLIRWNWNAEEPMASENFKKFTTENGLPDNILYRIEEDGARHLWISSYNGLVKFNKDDFSTKIYRTRDGLINSEFNRISSCKDARGRMYFGGQNGIDAFDPDSLAGEQNSQTIPFRLIGIAKFSFSKNNTLDLTPGYFHQQPIIMEPGDHSLAVSFSLLDFEDRLHRYAYKIEGLDREWNYINENMIRLSRLPYGKLNIRIKAQLESGNWSPQEMLLPVTVLKPYYQQSWFFIALFILLLVVFGFIYLLRVNKLQKDKNRLESLVQKRTLSLSDALDDRELLLKEIHHRVKNNLQVITGLLQLQKEGLKDHQVLDAFNEGQSRVNSIALIHQNLYQNKDLGHIEFKSFLTDLFNQVAELYEHENRKIELDLRLDEVHIDIDTAVPLGLIVNEMFTNSYKYAFVGQKNMRVEISMIQPEKGKYRLTYQDNGPGLKTMPDFNQATTLGIKLIGGLAQQLSGRAEYVSGHGCRFDIHFEDTASRKMGK